MEQNGTYLINNVYICTAYYTQTAMATAKKILFITQEMIPYVPDTEMSVYGRTLSQKTQENNHEIRSFMPKWGGINERRNQLHEVIRLSGMNMIIDDTDHPLIIKVASITAARMQVYFIDNEDYFGKRLMSYDADGKEYTDNPERAVFYARGVLETVKKLKWVPDVIHCQGWISSIVPLYVKTAYKEEPSFRDCKVVYTPTCYELKAPLPQNMADVISFRTADISALDGIQGDMDMQTLNRLGIKYADGVAFVQDNAELQTLAQEMGKLILPIQNIDDLGTAYPAFFDQV